MLHEQLYGADYDQNDAKDSHVNLVLLRRQHALRDRRALPEPALEYIRLYQVQNTAGYQYEPHHVNPFLSCQSGELASSAAIWSWTAGTFTSAAASQAAELNSHA